MFNPLESIGRLFTAAIYFLLLAAGAAAAVVIAYVIIMSSYRLCGLLWRAVFERPW